MAAPSAPVYCGSGETCTAQDKAVSRARTMPDCSATPPVKQTGGDERAARQRRDAQGDGVLHAGGDIRRRDAFGEQADDLGLGKDHAHAADQRRLAAVTAEFPQRGQINAQPCGDDLQEAATAGGTAVVHGEVPHAAAVFEGDELAVLPADFDDGADFRGQVVDALGVAGDLGNGRVGKPHCVAAIAGGDDGADRRPVQLRVPAGAFEQLRRQPLLFHALIGEAGADDAGLFGIEQHHFGARDPASMPAQIIGGSTEGEGERQSGERSG